MKLPPHDIFVLEHNIHAAGLITPEQAALDITLRSWVSPDQLHKAIRAGSIYSARWVIPLEHGGGAEVRAAADIDVLMDAIAPTTLPDRVNDLRIAVRDSIALTAAARSEALRTIGLLERLIS